MNKINIHKDYNHNRFFMYNNYLFGEFKYIYDAQRIEVILMNRPYFLKKFMVDVKRRELVEGSVDETIWYAPIPYIYKISRDIFMRQLSSLLRIEELYV